MSITLPKGYSSVPLLTKNKTAFYEDEFEILLHRNSEFKINYKYTNKMKIGAKETYIIYLFMEAIK